MAKYIYKKDIEDFFELEAEESKAHWEATMKLFVEERIRKRKAIYPAYLDKDFCDCSDEGNSLLKVTFEQNLSDFKEGECLILHREGINTGISCTVNRFEGDNAIIIEVYGLTLQCDNLSLYHDIPLVLDKNMVDLREHVYYKFLAQLSSDNSFWMNLKLNTKPVPVFKDKAEMEVELEDTIANFHLSLLPQQREAIINSMAAEDYYLIQGPPGTGKSFVLSFVILEEIAYFNHKVIVIGPNHMAINNTLIQVAKNCSGYFSLLHKVGQTYNAPDYTMMIDGEEKGINNYARLNVWAANKAECSWVMGLTPHSLYTSRARDLECDTLIIDEAGQMTIPLALMGMIKANKVIFAGDHKQLPPIVSSEKVKEELKQSVFQALIAEHNCTMLDTSFRMCKPICDFVSELFYDGQLKAMKEGHGSGLICNEPLYSFDAPVVLCEVDDEGEQVSDKEAEFIANTIAGFIQKGVSADEIAVLSPFRAQAANIRRAIRKHEGINEEDRQKIASDTIDKMQGQEREVILYSLVSGDIDYMTEMAEFLYNPNKMNVAFSRAKSKLIIVGSLSKIASLELTDYPHIDRMLKSQYVTKI